MSAHDVLSWWSFLFLGFLIYAGGRFAKDVIAPKLPAKIQTLYWRTIVVHPPLVGALAVLVPGFPFPEQIPATLAARVIFGLTAGITCAWSYKAVERVLGRDTASTYGRADGGTAERP